MRRVTLRTGLGVAIVMLALLVVSPRLAAAQVTIVQEPDRPNGLLYSANSDQNCSELHAMDPATLPYNVVRLKAEAVGADTYTWSLPKPQVGLLLADDDLAPQETTAAIRGFCAEFGNSCLLTAKTLKFYNKDTILYAAPTCDVLPKDTSKPFGGGSVTIKVVAKAANKKLGKAATEVRWGSADLASVTLYATYPPDTLLGPRTSKDGNGVDSVEGFAIQDFSAVEDPLGLPGLPALTNFAFQFAGGGASAPTCEGDTDDCVTLETTTPGTYFSTVKATLSDGSALCDALNVQVGACPRKAQVQVIRVPSKRTYKSGDLVRLRVRFANLSPNREGCGLGLSGANVLGCAATFKIGKAEESKSDQWDLRHCSLTTSQPCNVRTPPNVDGDCACLSAQDCKCPDCEPNETCLAESHCSQTFTQKCSEDTDCDNTPEVCPSCKEDETCVHVLDIAELSVAPGQAVDLVDEVVTLKNEIGSPVGIKETWTANAFPGTSAAAGIKYQIKNAD